jgi:hypothetical protein
LALAVLVLSGCAIGAGTTTVGIWRPQRVVDTQVCVRSQPGPCERSIEVGHDMPARSFAGGVFSWFNPGYMRMSGGRNLFALDSHYEYLRGRGGVALGARIGGNVAIASGDTGLFAVPLTVVGHWGYPRYSLYGGAGYTPYATTKDSAGMTATRHGFNALGGARVLLKATRSVRMTASVDLLHHEFWGGVRATSATFAIGLHF